MWPTTSLDFYCISTPQQLSKVSTFLCYELTKTNMAMCAFEKDRVSVCWREKTGRQGHAGCCCSAYWQMSACMYPYLSMFNGCFHKQQIKSQIICFLCYGWGEKNNQTEPYQCCTKNHKGFVSSREDSVSGQVSWIIRVSSPVCQLGVFQWKPWYLPSPGIAKHIVCAVNSVINLTSSLRQLSMKECYSLCSGMISDQATCAHFLKQIRARFAWLHRGRAVTLLKQTGTVQIA